MRPPVEVGQRLPLEVEDLGTSGDGVARHRDYVLFVEGGVPGDRVGAEVVSAGNSFGRARIREFLRSSEIRERAPCRLYGICGGCQLQHIDYRAEEDFKRQWVAGALRRIAGREDLSVDTSLSDQQPYGYRHRLRFTPRVGGDESLEPCFYRRDGQGLVAVDRCEVATEAINGLLGTLVEGLREPGVSAGPGWDRIALHAAGDQLLLVFGTGTGAWAEGPRLARWLMSEVPGLAGVVRNVALPEDLRARRPGALNLPLAGRDHLYTTEGDFRIRASAGVFSQVNPGAAALAYDRVLAGAGVGPGDTVIELFSGIGALSLRLAAAGAFVIGVDLDGAAVADARSNAAANDVDSVVHLNADAAEGLARVLASGTEPTVIVMDPPRSGCSRALLDAVAASGAERLVYVSCHYGTWARDLRYLARSGWAPRAVTPVDMFPRTTSVELVSVIAPGGGI